MRALAKRVAVVGRVVEPPPDRAFLAYARAVVACGGIPPDHHGADAVAIRLSRWLESERRTMCGPG